MRTRRSTGRIPGALLLTGALAFGACSGGEEPGSSETPVMEATEPAGGITVVSPWVRVAIMPEGSDAPDAPPVNSAAYLVLRNATTVPDALVAVETAASDTAEIHTVTMDDGVMRMRPVDSVAVPAHGEAVLEPGGYHIMLIGLHQPLAEGDSVDLTLTLGSGTTMTVRAPVRRSPPGM